MSCDVMERPTQTTTATTTATTTDATTATTVTMGTTETDIAAADRPGVTSESE